MDDKVNFAIDKGLIFMLAGLAKVSHKEVWCQLSEITQECIDRIKKNYKKKGQTESWKWFTYPNADIKMKVKVYQRGGRTIQLGDRKGEHEMIYYNANIKLDRNGYEQFTSEQVQEFLLEEILLGSEAAKVINE